MTSTPLPDEDHVSRYCNPSAVEGGLPMASAFIPRRGEEYLSVNWLEYFSQGDLIAAVERVREAFRVKSYRVRENGRLAVLNVGAAKTAAREGVDRALSIDHLPVSNDQSHAGIRGYGSEDLAVAVELATLVTRQDVHPAVT